MRAHPTAGLDGRHQTPHRRSFLLYVRPAATVVALCVLSWSCAAGQAEVPERVVRIMTSNPSGDYYVLGGALARIYDHSIGKLRVTIQQPGGGGGISVGAIEDGSAELAFTSAEDAYEAFVRGTRNKPVPHQQLRGVVGALRGRTANRGRPEQPSPEGNGPARGAHRIHRHPP
jgi:hypothetical protein